MTDHRDCTCVGTLRGDPSCPYHALFTSEELHDFRTRIANDVKNAIMANDKKIEGGATFMIRRDQKTHYPGTDLFVGEVIPCREGAARFAVDYPGPTIMDLLRVSGVEVKEGDEVFVSIKISSRVFTERRKP